MAEPARHLRAVDPDTGEVHERCPNCAELEAQLAGVETDVRAWRTRFHRLKRDKERETREHDLFPTMKRLYDLWRTETGHARSRLTPARFDLALPYLTSHGEGFIERAIAGIAYNPIKSSQPNRNGTVEVYDQWENLFKNAAALERYHQRAPFDPLLDFIFTPLRAADCCRSYYFADGTLDVESLPVGWGQTGR